MSGKTDEVYEAQLTFVSAHVRQLDPTASDTAIARYLAEIETMATALRTLDLSGDEHAEPFNPEWTDGASR